MSESTPEPENPSSTEQGIEAQEVDATEVDTEADPDGDPENLHPRDLRGTGRTDPADDPDGDPEMLNPHD